MNTGFKSSYFKELVEVESGNFWFCGRNELILWAISRYHPEMKSFLEIGCGTGFVIAGVSKRFPDVKLFGSEYLEDGLVFARQRVPTAEFKQLDARCILLDSELDAIGSFDVLEHIAEDEIVLQQMFKALKPGGFAYITVPQHRWLWSAVDEYACHVRRYETHELDAKVRAVGFEVVRSTSFISFLLPVMYISRLFKQGRTETRIDEIAELRINPILNKVFELVLRVELALIRVGFSFPVGGSRLMVARKPLTIKKDEKE